MELGYNFIYHSITTLLIMRKKIFKPIYLWTENKSSICSFIYSFNRLFFFFFLRTHQTADIVLGTEVSRWMTSSLKCPCLVGETDKNNRTVNRILRSLRTGIYVKQWSWELSWILKYEQEYVVKEMKPSILEGRRIVVFLFCSVLFSCFFLPCNAL